jgi:hypothetical protein
MKAIRAADVHVGDVLMGGKVRAVRINADRTFIDYEDGGCGLGLSDSTLILLHRPWPEGKTANDMLAAVEACARRLAEAIAEARAISEGQVGIEHDHRENPQDVLAELRGAIDAYELGMPRDPGVSSDPREAAIDASCGYLGGGGVGC